MVLLVLAIIILFVGVAVKFSTRSSGSKRIGNVAFAAALLISVGLIVTSSVASVPTGYTGIVSTFGKVSDTTLDAGINAKAPWQQVILIDNRVQKANSNLQCFSSDIQEVLVSYTVNYQIDKKNAQEIYKSVGVGYYDTVVTPNIAEAVKVVMARYTAEELISSRTELANAIEVLLAEQLSKYNIELVSTAIEDMDFTDEFTNAVEAKQVAVQAKLKAQTEQEQKTMEAEQAAKRATIEAQASAEVSKIQAQADLEVSKIQADAAEYAGQKEAAKNKAVAEALTEELLKYNYIQQWDGKLPTTYVGSDDVSTIITGIEQSGN